MNDFQTVCSYVQFKNDVEWKYDLMLSTKLYRSYYQVFDSIKKGNFVVVYFFAKSDCKIQTD